MKLDELNIGEMAEITAVLGSGRIRSRLMDFGLVPGTRVFMMRRAPGGGPFEIRVRGTLVSLRPGEARMIEVEPVQHHPGFHRGHGHGHHGKGRKHRRPWHWLKKWFD